LSLQHDPQPATITATNIAAANEHIVRFNMIAPFSSLPETRDTTRHGEF
jgi:hypothetical protein